MKNLLAIVLLVSSFSQVAVAGVGVAGTVFGNIYGNNGATLYYTSSSSYQNCYAYDASNPTNYYYAYRCSERAALAGAGQLHIARLSNMSWNPNSARGGTYMATADNYWYSWGYVGYGNNGANSDGNRYFRQGLRGILSTLQNVVVWDNMSNYRY